MKYDILIAGVGGQGTVLASRLLAASAIEAGYFARTAETIGMAQRGGCVVSHVRIGSQNCSPVIPLRTADLLIGFEPAEAARNIHRLNKDGRCIVNTHMINPVTASLNGVSYDIEAIKEYIKGEALCTVFLDGYSLAQKAGSVKTLNIVLLGAAAGMGFLPLNKNDVEKAIIENVSRKYVDINIKAFNLGFEFAENKIY